MQKQRERKPYKFGWLAEEGAGYHLITHVSQGLPEINGDRLALWINIGCGHDANYFLNCIPYARRVVGIDRRYKKISYISKLVDDIFTLCGIKMLSPQRLIQLGIPEYDFNAMAQDGDLSSIVQLLETRDVTQIGIHNETADLITFFGVLNKLNFYPESHFATADEVCDIDTKRKQAAAILSQAFSNLKSGGYIASSVSSVERLYGCNLTVDDEISLFSSTGLKDIATYQGNRRALVIGRK